MKKHVADGRTSTNAASISRRCAWFARAVAVAAISAACSFTVLSPVATAAGGSRSGGSWQEAAPLNIGRYGCKAYSIDGRRVIALAGWGDVPGAADSTAEIFDASTGAWALTAPMPAGFSPGANAWTARIGDDDAYLLVAGGFNSFLESGDLSSYVYSVRLNAWIKTGNLPAGATVVSNFGQIHAVVLDNGQVLIASGLARGVGETNASLLFTPDLANLRSGVSGEAAGTWDFTRDSSGRVTTLNGASEHHNLIKMKDGRVLLIHGNDHLYTSARFGEVYSDTRGAQAELFDPATGQWSRLPDLPAIPGEDDRHNGVKGVRQLASGALLADGRVLIAGGLSQPVDARGKPLLREGHYVRSSAILFDPGLLDAGTYPWSITGSMHVPRYSQVMAKQPGSTDVMSVGGWIDSAANWTATAEVYDPDRGEWSLVPGLPALAGTEIPASLPFGCSAILPDGSIVIAGGAYDLERDETSRRTYFYRR